MNEPQKGDFVKVTWKTQSRDRHYKGHGIGVVRDIAKFGRRFPSLVLVYFKKTGKELRFYPHELEKVEK